MNFRDLIDQAGDNGPCIGVQPQTQAISGLPTGFELRTIGGATTKTPEALFDAFAQAWDFPPWFGRNSHAFDDFMRDLDNMIETAYGKPTAPGYLTHITDAHLILLDQPEAFAWFAKCMPFYRDYYRDEADPKAVLGLLLSAPPDHLDEVNKRWASADVSISSVTA